MYYKAAPTKRNIKSNVNNKLTRNNSNLTQSIKKREKKSLCPLYPDKINIENQTFKTNPRLTSQSWSSYQLNHLRNKAASDSTLQQLTVDNLQSIKYWVFYFHFKTVWKFGSRCTLFRNFFYMIRPHWQTKILSVGFGLDICINWQHGRFAPAQTAVAGVSK